MVNDCGVSCANGFITARQGCRALQVCFAQYKCRAEACLRRCRNYQARTNLFVCTVCRFAERHAQWSAQPFARNERYGCGVPLAGACPTKRGTHPRRRARPPGAPVQELPTLYKSVRFHCLPLRGTDGACPIPTFQITFAEANTTVIHYSLFTIHYSLHYC